jgi:hypothetical protein
VAAQGHYAYVGIASGAADISQRYHDGGILVFDVANPAEPVWRSAFEAGRPVTSLDFHGAGIT